MTEIEIVQTQGKRITHQIIVVDKRDNIDEADQKSFTIAVKAPKMTAKELSDYIKKKLERVSKF